MHLISGFWLPELSFLSLLGWGRLISLAVFGSVKGTGHSDRLGNLHPDLLGGLLNAGGLVSARQSLIVLSGWPCADLSQTENLFEKWRQIDLAVQDR